MGDPIVHFEIPADDLERAQKFYKTAFGWSMDGMPGMGYVMVGTTPVDEATRMPKQPGAINGGMLKRQAPINHVVITVNVASIEKASAKIKKAGGNVVREKMAVGDVGFAAYFKDTEGNIVGLWENAKPR